MARKSADAIKAVHDDRPKLPAPLVMESTTLKGLRKAARRTQEDLATALGVGQDTVSRLEKRSDMLLSTLRHYIESVGGRLDLVVTLPDRPPLVIDGLGAHETSQHKK